MNNLASEWVHYDHVHVFAIVVNEDYSSLEQSSYIRLIRGTYSEYVRINCKCVLFKADGAFHFRIKHQQSPHR